MKFQRYVFISYKSEEYRYAQEVKRFLEENGLRCWMAPESIQGGASYAKEIPRAIRRCDIFVLILSERCQQSKWVSRELDQALNEDKLVMPIEIERCELNDEFEFYLRNVQRYEAYRNKDREFARMLDDIQGQFPDLKSEEVPVEVIYKEELEPVREVVSKPVKIRKGKKQKNKSRRFWILGVAVILAMVFGLIELTGKVTIAGTKVEKDAKGIYLNDVEFTEEDMEKIAELKEVRTIELTNCNFPSTDLSAIFNHDIFVLKLENCNLTNEHFANADFEMYPELLVLQLGKNPELTSLGNVALAGDTIYLMDISNTGILDLNFLTTFTNIEKFMASGNEIQDISRISNCAKLRNVDLSNNNLLSLEALSSCDLLEEVTVNNNHLSNLKGLENALWLKEINAGDNRLATIEGLENATILERVYLDNNELTDLSVLEKSKETLKELHFSHNQIADISFLKNAESLQNLFADHNQIESMESLVDCKNLQALSLSHNKIQSMDRLSGVLKLEGVDLSNNQIEQLNILVNEKNIRGGLNLSNNRITNVEALADFSFGLLDLRGNNIDSLTPLESCSGGTVKFDYHDTIDYVGLTESEFLQFNVVNCPKDKQVELTNLFGAGEIQFVETEDEVAEIKRNGNN